MKIYSYLNIEQFSNCYLVINEMTMQALMIDPCKIHPKILAQIESGPYHLDAVLITHNHAGHIRGLSTLRKIYEPKIYAADYEVASSQTIVIKDDGVLRIAGMEVRYFSIPGHSFDSMAFQIGRVIFTGDVITAGLIGKTYSNYAKGGLISIMEAKILSQDDSTVMLPGHGPPTSVGAEKKYNIDIQWNKPPWTL
ncbi:MAG: MBL fold metallo-hydrolase [Treponema sp.]|jgi:glyoxylase-like metal-dependent hydrolase (beta-lactamase superfamily II)|nr:MBL fold metallo-hydrolase [Treponema sp.]